MLILGHRGAPGYPRTGENTLGSFEKALQCGADGFEFDVRRCADGHIVVIHDDTIDRTTSGKGRVADLTYAELRRFDAGFGEPVPLLDDVLDRFGNRCLLHIELKDRGVAANVRSLVLKRKLERRVIVSSFEWQELEQLPPAIPIALLTSKSTDLIAAAREFRAAAVHPVKDIVTPELVDSAHRANLRVHTWTVNELEDVARFRAMGVDGIFTDCPERCLKAGEPA